MKQLRKGLAFVLALCMSISMMAQVPVDAQAASKTVTVKTQKELNKALKSAKATKIKIVTTSTIL